MQNVGLTCTFLGGEIHATHQRPEHSVAPDGGARCFNQVCPTSALSALIFSGLPGLPLSGHSHPRSCQLKRPLGAHTERPCFKGWSGGQIHKASWLPPPEPPAGPAFRGRDQAATWRSPAVAPRGARAELLLARTDREPYTEGGPPCLPPESGGLLW